LLLQVVGFPKVFCLFVCFVLFCFVLFCLFGFPAGVESWLMELEEVGYWKQIADGSGACLAMWYGAFFWFCLRVWDCSMKIERLKKQEMDIELGGQEHKL